LLMSLLGVLPHSLRSHSCGDGLNGAQNEEEKMLETVDFFGNAMLSEHRKTFSWEWPQLFPSLLSAMCHIISQHQYSTWLVFRCAIVFLHLVVRVCQSPSEREFDGAHVHNHQSYFYVQSSLWLQIPLILRNERRCNSFLTR